ncbi:hypothetical protein [Arthrobacter sp. PsM3]|uniref:hypothetical protein n=1 Tax=Arthrobacter sp. PsM3 TaxID=3030531 RepID=UPI00263AD9EF|nr:hypothetical protein [Arthrobacter sp. PsM3]MDN4645365.1 hypothetical protein [Arthrobacter sp. PsM3]
MARRTQEKDTDLSLVESTGNVEFDASPVTTEQPAENKSTGEVEFDAAPVTTEISYYTEDVIVRAETPGPVTVSFPGLPGVQNKVIEPPAPDAAPAPDAHALPATEEPAPSPAPEDTPEPA